MKHSNTAIFVPHEGCPNQCSFCNQKIITGRAVLPNEYDVAKAARIAVTSKNHCPQTAEIAFFGGSFTAIDRDYMIRLLDAAYPFVESGDFHGIRISTRPDAIDDDVLTVLKNRGVTAIELGAQSMNDTVLALNRRGHTAAQVESACELIKRHGFSLGLQMMTGLYGDTDEFAEQTARSIIALAPDTVRIYPTIVLKGTYLGELFEKGKYRPQTLDEAVLLCSRLIPMFESAGVRVIRVGLHDSESLSADYIAGPYHPAFKELCDGELIFNKIVKILENTACKNVIIKVPQRSISKTVGQRRKNMARLEKMGYRCRVAADDTLAPGGIEITEITE